MAAPLLLAPWLWSLFSGIVIYFAEFFGKKMATVLATIAAFAAIVATFNVAINSIFLTLQGSLPVGAFKFGLGLLPSNTEVCILAVITAEVASIGYVYWRNIIAFRLQG